MRKTLTNLEGWTRSLEHPLYPDDDVCEEMLPNPRSSKPNKKQEGSKTQLLVDQKRVTGSVKDGFDKI